MPLKTDFICTEKLWLKDFKETKLKTIINQLFNLVVAELKYNLKNKTIEISFNFTNDTEIKKINKLYRKKDKATNVLSFPTFEKEFPTELKKSNYIMLGDMILSYQTFKKEAAEQNKSLENHLKHLIIHSILHLFGYDHLKENERKIMENLEINILKKLNITNPYK